MKIVVTGTRAFGPARPDSDLDIVVNLLHAQMLLHLLHELDIPIEESSVINPDYEGFSFRIPENFPKVQIVIAVGSRELESWRVATEEMKRILYGCRNHPDLPSPTGKIE